MATAKFCCGRIMLWVWKETDIVHFCKQSSFYGICFTTVATATNFVVVLFYGSVVVSL
jgi:hypothetical protein